MSKEVNNSLSSTSQVENSLDQNYWNERWQKKETGWDMGQPSPAIVTYMEQYTNKNAAILIPGCGNAYEAEYLLKNGFTNITLIDIAPKAVEALKEKFADNPQVKVICDDFFNHNGHYDLIIEQTLFCAIPVERRREYAEKTATLLNDNGKIIGLLFNKNFNQPFPPFGGHLSEYKPVFEPHFNINTMNECYNSIAPRKGAEVFINLVKKTI